MIFVYPSVFSKDNFPPASSNQEYHINLLILVLYLQVCLSRNIGKSLVKLRLKHRKCLIYRRFFMSGKSCRGIRTGFLPFLSLSISRKYEPDFQYFRIFRTFQEASAFALSITLQESTPLFTNLV